MSINKERIKHVITRAIASISRVSRLTGAIMRSLGIITERIDVTVMGVGRTLVNIYERKLQREKREFLINNHYSLGTRLTHTRNHWIQDN